MDDNAKVVNQTQQAEDINVVEQPQMPVETVGGVGANKERAPIVSTKIESPKMETSTETFIQSTEQAPEISEVKELGVEYGNDVEQPSKEVKTVEEQKAIQPPFQQPASSVQKTETISIKSPIPMTEANALVIIKKEPALKAIRWFAIAFLREVKKAHQAITS